MLRVPCLSLNDLALEHRLGKRSRGEISVDPAALRRVILSAPARPCVFYGHLLPAVFERGDLDRVAVLRCEPTRLKERLLERGYRGVKLREDVEAELIGVSASEAFARFGPSKVCEFDSTTADPQVVAEAVASFETKGVREAPIDWVANYDSAVKLRSLLSGATDGPGRI